MLKLSSADRPHFVHFVDSELRRTRLTTHSDRIILGLAVINRRIFFLSSGISRCPGAAEETCLSTCHGAARTVLAFPFALKLIISSRCEKKRKLFSEFCIYLYLFYWCFDIKN
jgi:hypothetical protein